MWIFWQTTILCGLVSWLLGKVFVWPHSRCTAGEVKTGVALPNPKRILVAPATARLQVWAYEVSLDFFRVYFYRTILARAIRFGFGSRERERKKKREEKCWLELTHWTFPCTCAFCREEQPAHFVKNGSYACSKSITIPCAMSFRTVIHRINQIWYVHSCSISIWFV